jgi:isopenicillin-N N-acyltransferase-like protein
MSGLPTVTLAGTPRERGVAHGERFADEIAHNAEFYLEHFAENGVPESTSRAYADRLVDAVEEMNGTYATEMRGVAEGSGVGLTEVTLVNMRHTILYSAYADGDIVEEADATDGAEASPAAEPDGCTSFGLQPEVTATGHTYVGQNWDWKAAVEPVLMDVRRESGPDYLAVTEAGMVGGKFGMNELGYGFVVNGLSTAADGRNPYRKPAHVRDYEMLRAERFEGLVEPVVGTPRPTSRNYLLGNDRGELIDVETSPDATSYLYPEDGVLTHANHFETRDVESTFEAQVPHSLSRGVRVRRLFERLDRPVTEADVMEILRDHYGRPLSLCRHAEGEEVNQTNVSVVMDLDDRRMLVTGGPPCEGDYAEHVVGGAS